MTEAENSGQRLLLAAIKLGTARNARDEAADAYMVAFDEYDDAFKEYAQIMEGQ